MPHHEHRRCSWLVICRLEHAAVKCRHAKEFKCARRDVCSVKQLDAFSVLVEHEIIGSGNNAVKNVVLPGKFKKFIRRVSLTVPFLPPGSIMNAQKDHACWILIGKRCEQHVVDYAENRSRGADP